ncbi:MULTISPECIES: type 2 isopentenyl-diphosphate Delta-isomerase [Rhodomicrobium]|uniref:type 2 isopentenyl-diphosphate Delta-isomerase n=1 Tax=Rhodomicrobium TaxID=1068 RepID=UPI000B4C1E12|nr:MULTISPECIES: type 2 isopentenyl-diphosphate Delta-isomerase [Rhodomicrobium]
MSDMLRRKDEHLNVVLTQNVRTAGTTGFEAVQFEHVALPEMHLDDVDLSAAFLGRRMQAPLLISSMTGGPAKAAAINETLARAAGQLGIAFAVGSQRVAIEDGGSFGFGRELRGFVGEMPLLSNLGAAQLAQPGGAEMARRVVEMIGADALIIHLNPLQEAVQHGGDRDWSGLLGRIEALVKTLPVPVIVKEVGSGISGPLAKRLWDAGVRIIDVAGAGGTSWAAVEAGRAPNARLRAVAETFRDWGIPTARAVADVRAACPDAVVIASGGIRSGLDAAKAIRLGADLVGQAAGVLSAALQGVDAVTAHFEDRIAELRIACFCTGSPTLNDLRQAPLIP